MFSLILFIATCPGALDHHLDVVPPGDLGEFAEGLQFGELRLVVGVRGAAGTQAVAEGEGDVVLLEQFADLLEVRVEERLPDGAPSTTPP